MLTTSSTNGTLRNHRYPYKVDSKCKPDQFNLTHTYINVNGMTSMTFSQQLNNKLEKWENENTQIESITSKNKTSCMHKNSAQMVWKKSDR